MATNNPGCFLLKKVRGAAGTDYFTLLTGACPQFGHFRCLGLLVTIDFCIPQTNIGDIGKNDLHFIDMKCRRSRLSIAGTQFLEERDSEDRQLISLCLF